MNAEQQVVFTSLETHNKDDLAKSAAAAGFLIGPGVSKKTTLLVAGDPNVDSSKARKAKDYGIPVISEKEFVDAYLGGKVKIDFEAETFAAPTSADDLNSPKRDVKALKLVLAGIRPGVVLHAHLDGDYGQLIVRGPATYSPLGEAWMVGGMPIANKNLTPDKSLRLLGASDGADAEHRTDELSSLQVDHHLYGNFTVYGPVRKIVGTMNGVGPWIIAES